MKPKIIEQTRPTTATMSDNTCVFSRILCFAFQNTATQNFAVTSSPSD
jgi:hypothetical protein